MPAFEFKNPSKLIWYSARVLFRCVVQGDKRKRILFEETIFLVRALHDEDARKKALTIARKKQHSYNNMFKKKVRWEFHELLEVLPLDDQRMVSGAEVYWRLFRKRRAKKTVRGFLRSA